MAVLPATAAKPSLETASNLNCAELNWGGNAGEVTRRGDLIA